MPHHDPYDSILKLFYSYALVLVHLQKIKNVSRQGQLYYGYQRFGKLPAPTQVVKSHKNGTIELLPALFIPLTCIVIIQIHPFNATDHDTSQL
jgi:hypothetical protein